ncbi:hypothetical protein CCP3SC1AL1_1380010 [Gammaproteobacteria bacterium]
MDFYRAIKNTLLVDNKELQLRAEKNVKNFLIRLNVIDGTIKELRMTLTTLEKDKRNLKYDIENADLGNKEIYATIKLNNISKAITETQKKILKLVIERDSITKKLDFISSKYTLDKIEAKEHASTAAPRSGASTSAPKSRDSTAPAPKSRDSTAPAPKSTAPAPKSTASTVAPKSTASTVAPKRRSILSRVKSQVKKNPRTTKAVGAGLAALGAYGLYKVIKRRSAKKSKSKSRSKSKSKRSSRSR